MVEQFVLYIMTVKKHHPMINSTFPEYVCVYYTPCSGTKRSMFETHFINMFEGTQQGFNRVS